MKEASQTPSKRFTPGKMILLIVLLVLCLPVGVAYLLWLIGGRAGLFAAIGCLSPLLLVLLWVAAVAIANANPDFGEHVNHVSWLPEEATDISYYKSYSFTAYEFKISEKGFKNWANPSWSFTEIVEPETIPRYNDIIESRKYDASYPAYDHDAYQQLQKLTRAMVTHGIVSQIRRPNGGGYHAVYDRDTGTGYFQSNPR